MENDKNDINNNEKLISTDIYKIEFSGQKLDNNNKFLNWKKDMINLYGNNLKLIKCKKDNIYFCIEEKKINHDDEDIYIYRYKCPLCNKYICPDCQKAFSRNDEDCCIKGRIKTIIFEGPKFGVDIFEQWIEYLLLIPFISFIYIIGGVLNSLFFQLLKPVTYKEEHEFSQRYSYHFKDKSIITFLLLFGIKVLFALAIMVSFCPFVILDGIITIFIILISIPFKFYPLKYVLGMLVAFFDDIILI